MQLSCVGSERRHRFKGRHRALMYDLSQLEKKKKEPLRPTAFQLQSVITGVSGNVVCVYVRVCYHPLCDPPLSAAPL